MQQKLLLITLFIYSSIAGAAASSSALAPTGSADPFAWGLSAMQGLRPTMEDAFAVQMGFGNHPSTASNTAFFGIYDGHGGAKAAQFAAERLHKNIATMGIPDGFAETNNQLGESREFKSGTTAVTAIAEKRHEGATNVTLAWLGDSRAVLASLSGKVLGATKDHKLSDPAEQERIRKAGGSLVYGLNNIARVVGAFGGLNMSRSIGDLTITGLIREPEIAGIKIPGEAFLIMACDGLWDVVSNEAAAEIVAKTFAENPALSQDTQAKAEEVGNNPVAVMAARALRDEAFKRGSDDNISVIVVKL